MEYFKFNGNLFSVHDDIEKTCTRFCDEVTKIISNVKNENQALRAENARLKSEHYKDEEISRLLDEIGHWKKRCSGGFELSEDEKLIIDEWKAKHIQEKHNGNSYAGAIGGRFQYVFTPTSLGDIGEIECSCGDGFCFRDIS